MSDHPIPENHEAQLKKIMNLADTVELPARAVELYDEFRRTMRILGMPVTEHQLVLIPMFINRSVRESVYTFVDEAQDRELEPGDLICVKFRNQWKFAQFEKIDKHEKKIHATICDSADSRRFSYTSARFPTQEELAENGVTV